MIKGEPGGECARKACNNRPAVGFNKVTKKWYCRECTNRINLKSENGDLVIIKDVRHITRECKKTPYADKKSALFALKNIQKVVKARKYARGREKNVYKCPYCNYWHLTKK